MEFVEILKELGCYLLSAFIAFIVAKIKTNPKKTATKEQIAEKAQAKADKYYAKQCKKHNLLVEDEGGANGTSTNET